MALLVGASYLLWRTTTLGSGWLLVVSVTLFFTELWAYCELALLSFQAWTLPVSPGVDPDLDHHDQPRPDEPIDVIVVAAGQRPDQIEHSLMGATALAGTGRVIVIDSQHRPEAATATSYFPAQYLIDPAIERNAAARVHANAESELYLWLQAGQVPMPAALQVLRRHFEDRSVAVVQSAVGLMNAESLIHLRGGRDDEALIREVTGPAMSRFGVAPWSGPGSVIRRSAIDNVGGYASDSPIAVGRAAANLHHSGWKTFYEGGGHIRETAAETMAQYLDDRRARARNAFELLATGLPLGIGMRLPFKARLAQVASIAPFLRGIRLFLQLILLLIVLLSGEQPFEAPVLAVLAAWAISGSLGVVARWALARGSMAIGDFVGHGWRTVETDFEAVVDVVHQHRVRSTTMPDQAPGLAALGRLRLLTGAVIALDLALLARAVTLVAHDALPAMTTASRMAVLGIALLTLVPMVDVLQVVVLTRQRRKHHRLQADLTISIDGTPATTVDFSPSGVGVQLESAPPIGSTIRFAVTLPALDGGDQVIEGEAIVRASSPDPSGLVRVGLEFTDLSDLAQLVIIAYCVLGQAVSADRERGVLLAPGQLSVEQAAGQHRGLQLMTGLAVMGGVAVFLAGPSAAATTSAEDMLPVHTVCVFHADGSEAADATIEGLSPGGWTPLGTTPADGCLGVDGTYEDYAANFSGNRVVVEDDKATAGVANVGLPNRRVFVFNGDGELVQAEVRYLTDTWVDAITTNGEVVIESHLATTDVEIVWDGQRFVAALEAGDLILQLSVLRADDGTSIAEIDRGSGWEPFVDGMNTLPGRLAVRLSDGQVAKLEVPAGHEVRLPSGATTALAPVSPPTTTEFDSEPNPTTTSGPTTTSESTTTTGPEPTTTTEPDPTTTNEPDPTATTEPDPTTTTEPEPTTSSATTTSAPSTTATTAPTMSEAGP